MARSYTGPSSASDRAGTSATVISPAETRSPPLATSRPTTAASSPHRSQTPRTSSRRDGCTIASIRSCDSEVRISNGSRPGSRSGTASRSSSAPRLALDADSDTAHVRPAPPRSWSPSSRSRSTSSSEASISSLPANGSPICTLGRLSSAPSSIVRLASTDTPPIPSRPVAAPNSTRSEPSCTSRAEVTSRSAGAIPTHITLTLGLAECAGAKWTSPPTVGTPMQLPYPPMPATTPSKSQRLRSSVSGPKRSGSSNAIGRAPIEMMSRTMPPTPVAAPW